MSDECEVDHEERRAMGMYRCYMCDAILQDEAEAAALRALRDAQRKNGTLGLVEIERRLSRLESECMTLRIHIGALVEFNDARERAKAALT